MRKTAAGSFFLAVFALLGTGSANTSSRRETQAGSPDVCAVSKQNRASATPTPHRTRSNHATQLEPGATVSDACASYAELDLLNVALNPYVSDLVTKSDFFAYYRLNLYNKKCPFWSDENGLCGNIACAVTTLENEDDVPAVWRAEELSRLEGPKAHHPDRKEQRERPQKPLKGELGESVGESCVVEYDDECDERDYCVPEDESASAKGDYVSLVNNPERFTGYAGDGAHQVWEAIYRENCFSKPQTSEESLAVPGLSSSPFGGYSGPQAQAAQDLRSVMKDYGRQQAHQSGQLEEPLDFDDECLEKRVFYRVVSGMHASISTHLCHAYLNQTTGQWGPNLDCYKHRLHAHPERISNLYFNFALVLRAVGKLKDHVQDYTFCTGDPIEDRRTKTLITSLAEALPSGPEIFDESVMFRDGPDGLTDTGITLKEDFRNRFRNVSRIMDCVGCDKCRLWGKLQTAGYGTALKVLFEFGDDDASKPKPLLRRTELVALINTLDKISSAIKAVGEFEKMIAEEQKVGIVVEPAAAEGEARERAKENVVPEDDDDDDFEDYEEEEEKCPVYTKTFGEIFWEEWYNVWGAYVYVLKSWWNLPGSLFKIALSEISRLWDYWLGLPVRPRSWRVDWPVPPTRDEI